MNFILARASPDGRSLVPDLAEPQAVHFGHYPLANRNLIVGIRPEHLNIAEPDANGFAAPVGAVEFSGPMTFITTATEPEIVMTLNGRNAMQAGDRCASHLNRITYTFSMPKPKKAGMTGVLQAQNYTGF